MLMTVTKQARTLFLATIRSSNFLGYAKKQPFLMAVFYRKIN